MITSDNQSQTDTARSFPIVGVGASAGGVEACSQLLDALPDSDLGMAFVVVLHLDPRHDSMLADILGKTTRMPVCEAVDGARVEPDHVYVIPRNATLTIEKNLFHVDVREQTRTPHLPVDRLFKSIAAERQAGAIGVILSGSGSDGTVGMEDVKAAGGFTFAQDPDSARFASMPQSAARSGCVDRVLPPAGIARELVRISRHPYVMPEATGAVDARADEDTHYEKVLDLLRTGVGVDLRGYRDTTIHRRVMRRMALHTAANIGEYVERLGNDSAELEALYQDILINVTSFFREKDAFEALKESVFPKLMADRAASIPVRVWVPGCSTGQEAYTIAMVLIEYLDDKRLRAPIQIFATDLSDRVSLQKAREGLYPENIEAEVSPERLRRFFTREGSNYRINKSIRDLCVFAKQNVAADPPFSRVDLISCRNLLIYLAPDLQKRVIPTFHYALNARGFLMLGASETIGSFADLFATVDNKHRIYEKKTTAHRIYPSFRQDEFSRALTGAPRAASATTARLDWQREADRMVLGQYAPAGVLVNQDFDVLQFRGKTGLYLTPSPGEASFNLLKMAREGLFLELRSALNECRTQDVEVRRPDVRVRTENDISNVDLRVQPVKLPGVKERCFLVLFEDKQSPHGQALSDGLRASSLRSTGLGTRLRTWLAGSAPPQSQIPVDNGDVGELQRELASTREYLQAVIEQQDRSNEELKSANEEILSSNEELQSTNEELETAKEELQSVNEELTTINEQLQNRNAELSRLNDDVHNLLASANVPMVALGVDLRVRRFTPAAAKLLNLLPTDVGQPISNLKPAVDVPDFERLVAGVVDSVQPFERDVHDKEGRIYSLRVLPYRTADNKIDGTVIVLQDTSEMRIQANSLRRKVELINLSQDAIITIDGDTGLVTFWNQGAEHIYGWSEQEALGKSMDNLLRSVYQDGVDVAALLAQAGYWEGEVVHTTRDGAMLTIESRLAKVIEGTERNAAILAINRDVTPRRRLESELRHYSEQLTESDRRKNEFLAMLAHELRNPLAPIRNAAYLLQMKAAGDEDRDLCDMMNRQIRHITRLVDDLLDVTRITRGRIELRKESLNTTVVLREVTDNLRSMIENAGQSLAVTLPSYPAVVSIDPVRFVQIIENLVINAVKYSDRGARIDISLAREGNDAVIAIKDSGIGISAEMLPAIWDLFSQVDGSLERTRGGLGIGLTLVKHLVELHGGSVDARSDGLGHGSEFTIRLPLLEDQTPVALSKPAVVTDSAPSRRILVVDDNQDAADSMEALLKMLRHETRVAYSGTEAIETAERFNPEVVLLDIGLPGLNGYEVARRLRARDARVCIIAVTGYGSAAAIESGIKAGFNAHLLKPVELGELTGIIAGLESARLPPPIADTKTG